LTFGNFILPPYLFTDYFLFYYFLFLSKTFQG